MGKILTNIHVEEIYKLVSKRDSYLYDMYKAVDPKELEYRKTNQYSFTMNVLENFAKKLNLKLNDESMLALLNRLIQLREDDLVKLLEKLEKSEEEILSLRKEAYQFTKTFQMKIQSELLQKILFLEIPEFYKCLLVGVFKVGRTMNELNIVWDDYLLNTLNPMLEKEIDGNIRDYLLSKNLLEIDTRTNDIADRSYSVLIKDENQEYKSLSYALAFPNEVNAVVKELLRLTSELIEYKNGEKGKTLKEYSRWIKYFKSLISAFEETDNNMLIEKWADVDRKWMKIKSPLQVAHPLEYYEDKYRNAVCIEFDIRIDNVESSQNNKRVASMEPMFNNVFNSLNKENLDENNIENIYKASIKNMNKVQIHIGKQMFYFGATLNGLSSAQIVPNDEIISEEKGKKIFAFAEKSVDLNRAKPHLLINSLILGYEILDEYNKLLHFREKDFLEVYDITTMGHEYGHALFKNELAEIKMNNTGNYKNIEEFKASAGGLVAFFNNKDEEMRLWTDVLINTVMRAIKLISWKKNADLEPYYCEGLITLQILFKTGVLKFESNKLNIDVSNMKYLEFKKEYEASYKDLALHYLSLKDASLFLHDYCHREEDGFIYPVENETKDFDSQAKEFVNYYFKLNEEIGRDIDTKYSEHFKEISKNI